MQRLAHENRGLWILVVGLAWLIATSPVEAQRRLQSNPKTVFLIGGAKEVPYDEIIKALDLLHSAGVKSVGLMTQPI